MKHLILASLLSVTSAIGFADEHADLFQPVTSETDLKTFAWQNRLIVVFANSKEDVRLQTQIEYLKIGIDKTSGPKELEAWGWIEKKISEFKKK